MDKTAECEAMAFAESLVKAKREPGSDEIELCFGDGSAIWMITVADSAITVKVNSTAVTGATATIANSGSAAGDKYTITLNTIGNGEAGGRVVEGDNINIISDGGSSTTAAMTWLVEILRD